MIRLSGRLVFSGLGLLLAVVLAGCGGNYTNSQTPAPSEPAYEDTYSEPYEETAEFEDNFWIAATTESGDGSTADLKLRVGDLVAAEDYVAPEGFAGLESACEVDDERDALIPGELVVTNTTDRFPIEIDTGVMVAKPFDNEGTLAFGSKGLNVSVAQRFSDHDGCEFEEADLLAEVNFELSEDEIGSHEFIVIVHDYYSPEQPDGDEANLGYLRIAIDDRSSIITGWEQTCVSASLPLDGSSARLDGKRFTERAYEYSNRESSC